MNSIPGHKFCLRFQLSVAYSTAFEPESKFLDGKLFRVSPSQRGPIDIVFRQGDIANIEVLQDINIHLDIIYDCMSLSMGGYQNQNNNFHIFDPH